MAGDSPTKDGAAGAETALSDRLQPALLDRLTDDEPTRRNEPAERRFLSRSQLRASVLRDLAWLFNTTNLEEHEPMAQFAHARRSVLNYGIAPLSGRRVSDLNWVEMEGLLKKAVLDYEPRILPETLKVRAIVPENLLDHHNKIGFEIRCQLWSQPYPVELLLHTDVDLESGLTMVREIFGER